MTKATQRLVARDSTRCFDLSEFALRPMPRARCRLVPMKIYDFMSLVVKDDTEPTNSIIIPSAKIKTVPILYFTISLGKAFVTDHDGYAIAVNLLRSGYTKMPVELAGPIRWSDQDDPNKEDYLVDWPDLLMSETKITHIPFPVLRDNANSKYWY